MIKAREKSSLLRRISAGVKAVALVAVLGTLALAALAAHRGDVAAPASSAVVSSNTAAHAPEARSSVSSYLRQVANADAEMQPTQ